MVWHVNANGFRNVLAVAQKHEVSQVWCLSSIAAFRPDAPRNQTPQEMVLWLSAMHGVIMVTGQSLSDYHVERFVPDVQGVRYPGMISSEILPVGGTIDYALEMFCEARKPKRYICFLEKNAILSMAHMPDCIRATLPLVDAHFGQLDYNADFNLAGLSFSPCQLTAEMMKHVPGFDVICTCDCRQAIADSRPGVVDDSATRKEWGHNQKHALTVMANDLLSALGKKPRSDSETAAQGHLEYSALRWSPNHRTFLAGDRLESRLNRAGSRLSRRSKA